MSAKNDVSHLFDGILGHERLPEKTTCRRDGVWVSPRPIGA
jgi:hypothetical protein